MENNLIDLFNFNTDITSKIDLGVQLFLLIVFSFYEIFSFLVYKQIKILNKTITTPRAGLLNKLALIQLAFSTLLLLVTILVVIF